MGAVLSSFGCSSMVSTHHVFDSVLNALRKISGLKASLAPAASSSIPSFSSSILSALATNIV